MSFDLTLLFHGLLVGTKYHTKRLDKNRCDVVASLAYPGSMLPDRSLSVTYFLCWLQLGAISEKLNWKVTLFSPDLSISFIPSCAIKTFRNILQH